MGITPAHLETDLVEAVVRMVPLSSDILTEDRMLLVLVENRCESVDRPVANRAKVFRVVLFFSSTGMESLPLPAFPFNDFLDVRPRQPVRVAEFFVLRQRLHSALVKCRTSLLIIVENCTEESTTFKSVMAPELVVGILCVLAG